MQKHLLSLSKQLYWPESAVSLSPFSPKAHITVSASS